MNDSINKANPKFLYFSNEELNEINYCLYNSYCEGLSINAPGNRILREEIENTLTQRGIKND